MAKNDNVTNSALKVKRGIGKTLLTYLLPIILIGIVCIIVFISYNARQVITEVSLMDLKAEGQANASDLGTVFEMLTAKDGQYCDTLERVYFEDHEAMLKYVEPSADYNTVENTGIYIGFSDDSYFFANHQVQPADWRPTQRGWYSEGQGQETFVCTEPYVDANNGQLCVTFVRSVNCANGEKGVAAVDVFLTDLQEKVNALTPMKTGGSMVLDGDYIISYFDNAYNGTLVSESGSKYLEQVKALVESGKLAQNSQDAAKEIGDIIKQITGLISDLAEKSQNNMDSINASGEVVEKAGTSFSKIYDDLNEAASVMKNMINMMGEVNDIASSVAAISEEQSASSEEITATIYTLTESANQIATESQGVEDVANSVSDSALAINDELSKFKIESDINSNSMS